MEVCSNPLCRRKWKLLSAAALPFVCPSCRKALDSSLSRVLQTPAESLANLHSRPDYPVLVLKHWALIYSDIAAVLRFPKLKVGEIAADGNLGAAYARLFPPTPDAATVRNWSSIGSRKKPTVGRVVRKFGFVRELAECGTGNIFYFVDWVDEFEVDEEIRFLASANPSATERGLAPTLIKPISGQERETLPPSISDRSSLDTLLIEWAKSSSPEVAVATSVPNGRRPDWIPDTPATPLYLQQQEGPFAANAPPSALLDLLRAAASSSFH